MPSAGRPGRANVGVETRGLILAATPAELIGAVVTARAAKAGRVEPLRMALNPLDVLCQQLIGMACGGEWSTDDAYALARRSAPLAELTRRDFDACLDFLAGDLNAPSGAYEPEPGSTPKWTAPRIWKRNGLFGIRSNRVIRWFWSNVGTITSEESVRVQVDGQVIGSLEGAYAERLQAGDRFVLDGRSLEFRRMEGLTVHSKTSGERRADLPVGRATARGSPAELARDVARFRARRGEALADGPSGLRAWLGEDQDIGADEAGVLETLLVAQEQISEIPGIDVVLVEEYPDPMGVGTIYAFHAPLGRPASEAMARATAARLGRRFGRDLKIVVADLGWSITMPEGARITLDDLPALLAPESFDDDVLDGLDRGELMAQRFRHVAATALMVLRRPEGGRTRVGGLLWVSNRLFPLVQAACPDHPLLRETRREVLQETLDAPTAREWLTTRPKPRFRALDGPSPFAAAWIDPGGPEPMKFESPGDALRRLHERLIPR